MQPILESTRFVLENAEHVQLNQKRIEEFAHTFRTPPHSQGMLDFPFDFSSLEGEQMLMLLAVFHSLSFSYWSEPYWQVTRNGITYDRGAWSLIAAILLSKEEGKDLCDPHVLRNLTRRELAAILRGDGELPLLDERLSIAQELGQVLVEEYEGRFSNLLTMAKGDGMCLLDKLIKTFSYFQKDIAQYKFQSVSFHKKPQALVQGIYTTFNGKDAGNLENTHKLTALADYILPRLLRASGILEYSEELSRKVDARMELQAGGEEEVEIRANTIWAVEFLRQQLNAANIPVSTLDVNDYLWTVGTSVETPFHRVRTTAY